MIKTKNLGLFIIVLMIFSFSCGGSGESRDNTLPYVNAEEQNPNSTSSEKALADIQSFASNNDASNLTIDQLTTAGITGTLEGNFSEYKKAIADQTNISNISALQTLMDNVNSEIQNYNMSNLI